MDKENRLIIFESKKIRRIWHEDEWFYSVVDIVSVLTDSTNPRDYWYRVKKRVSDEEKMELSTICRQLKLDSSDGKKYKTDCANTEGVFRIVQSIPSPKAEPFKKWLAKVGYERVQEIENPELAQERMKKTYEQKGYPKDWIDKRIRGIAIRQNLTDEWRERGIHEHRDFAILTAEISRATFGMTPSEYKNHKNLPEEPDTFSKNKNVAKRGGSVAGNARKETEKELGRTVVSKKNYLEKEDKTLLSEIEDKS